MVPRATDDCVALAGEPETAVGSDNSMLGLVEVRMVLLEENPGVEGNELAVVPIDVVGEIEMLKEGSEMLYGIDALGVDVLGLDIGLFCSGVLVKSWLGFVVRMLGRDEKTIVDENVTIELRLSGL